MRIVCRSSVSRRLYVGNIIICDWKNGTGCGRTFGRCSEILPSVLCAVRRVFVYIDIARVINIII